MNERYYGIQGYPEWRPDFGSRLSLQYDQEMSVRPDAHGRPDVTSATGRVRVVIEGEADLVGGLLALMEPELRRIRAA